MLGRNRRDDFAEIDRRYQLTLSRSGSTLHHQLFIDLTDRAPAARREIGPHYFAYLRLYVPDAARQVTMRSAPSREYLPIVPPGRRSQRPPTGAAVTGGWVFVDETKNRSRRFCSMADCGNRAKQRRFQERQRKRA